MEKLEPYEFRCDSCGKLLAKNDFEESNFEVKCTRCGSLNSLFRYVDDQVVITDSEGVILYANNLLQDVTGYTLEEVVGKTPKVWGGQMSNAFYKKMWEAIGKNKQPIVVRVTNKNKKGDLYDAILHISPVFNTKGDICMYVGMETVVK